VILLVCFVFIWVSISAQTHRFGQQFRRRRIDVNEEEIKEHQEEENAALNTDKETEVKRLMEVMKVRKKTEEPGELSHVKTHRAKKKRPVSSDRLVSKRMRNGVGQVRREPVINGEQSVQKIRNRGRQIPTRNNESELTRKTSKSNVGDGRKSGENSKKFRIKTKGRKIENTNEYVSESGEHTYSTDRIIIRIPKDENEVDVAATPEEKVRTSHGENKVHSLKFLQSFLKSYEKSSETTTVLPKVTVPSKQERDSLLHDMLNNNADSEATKKIDSINIVHGDKNDANKINEHKNQGDTTAMLKADHNKPLSVKSNVRKTHLGRQRGNRKPNGDTVDLNTPSIKNARKPPTFRSNKQRINNIYNIIEQAEQLKSTNSTAINKDNENITLHMEEKPSNLFLSTFMGIQRTKRPKFKSGEQAPRATTTTTTVASEIGINNDQTNIQSDKKSKKPANRIETQVNTSTAVTSTEKSRGRNGIFSRKPFNFPRRTQHDIKETQKDEEEKSQDNEIETEERPLLLKPKHRFDFSARARPRNLFNHPRTSKVTLKPTEDTLNEKLSSTLITKSDTEVTESATENNVQVISSTEALEIPSTNPNLVSKTDKSNRINIGQEIKNESSTPSHVPKFNLRGRGRTVGERIGVPKSRPPPSFLPTTKSLSGKKVYSIIERGEEDQRAILSTSETLENEVKDDYNDANKAKSRSRAQVIGRARGGANFVKDGTNKEIESKKSTNIRSGPRISKVGTQRSQNSRINFVKTRNKLVHSTIKPLPEDEQDRVKEVPLRAQPALVQETHKTSFKRGRGNLQKSSSHTIKNFNNQMMKKGINSRGRANLNKGKLNKTNEINRDEEPKVILKQNQTTLRDRIGFDQKSDKSNVEVTGSERLPLPKDKEIKEVQLGIVSNKKERYDEKDVEQDISSSKTDIESIEQDESTLPLKINDKEDLNEKNTESETEVTTKANAFKRQKSSEIQIKNKESSEKERDQSSFTKEKAKYRGRSRGFLPRKKDSEKSGNRSTEDNERPRSRPDSRQRGRSRASVATKQENRISSARNGNTLTRSRLDPNRKIKQRSRGRQSVQVNEEVITFDTEKTVQTKTTTVQPTLQTSTTAQTTQETKLTVYIDTTTTSTQKPVEIVEEERKSLLTFDPFTTSAPAQTTSEYIFFPADSKHSQQNFKIHVLDKPDIGTELDETSDADLSEHLSSALNLATVTWTQDPYRGEEEELEGPIFDIDFSKNPKSQ